MKTLKLSEIVTNAGTQVRVKIDDATVAEYAEAMLDAANKFPPVVVFHDGSRYILSDGFHRVFAAIRNDFKDILADVHKGTKTDALKYALRANTSHGLKRTNADKRHSVELALAEWPKLSDREIAKRCGVSNNFVSEFRKELSSDDSSIRIGRDGKERKLPTKKPKADPINPSEPPNSSEPEEDKPRVTAGVPEPEPEDEGLVSKAIKGLRRLDYEQMKARVKSEIINLTCAYPEPEHLNDLAEELETIAENLRRLAKEKLTQ